MHKDRGLISIWFFIGVLLLAYGVLILGAAIYEVIHPPEQHVVLSELHAGLWWGVLLIIIGTVYSYRFSPGRKK